METSSKTDEATLAWLGDALGHAHAHGQTRILAYLEAVMEDAVFEIVDARKSAVA